MKAELVAERDLRDIGLVVASDARRTSFAVTVAGALVHVSGDDLSVARQWRLDAAPSRFAPGWGCHAVRGDLALLSAPEEVRLLEADGSARWTFAHDSWIGVGSGCAWFDEEGRILALIPLGTGPACRIVLLDGDRGSILDEAHVQPEEPAGMMPVHMGGNWVGVSEFEGENAARAWFVRADPDLEVIDAGWDDEHLTDSDQDGRRILTAGLDTARIRIRSFPDRRVIREFEAADELFATGACLVGSFIVARQYYREKTVVIDSQNRVEDLDVDDGWLVPAAGDSWLSVTRNGIRRWVLANA